MTQEYVQVLGRAQQAYQWANTNIDGHSMTDDQIQELKFQKYIRDFFYSDRYNESQLMKMNKFFEDENVSNLSFFSASNYLFQTNAHNQYQTLTQSLLNDNQVQYGTYASNGKIVQSNASVASMGSMLSAGERDHAYYQDNLQNEGHGRNERADHQ